MREKMTGDGGPETGGESTEDRRPETGKKSPGGSDHLDQATNATSELSSPVGEGEGQGEGEYNPKLTIRTHRDENTVTIEIEDNGPGVPDELKDKILQPFFTTKKGTQGTGLGLSITNDIVKAQGGSLELHSQAGQSVFTIKLTG